MASEMATGCIIERRSAPTAAALLLNRQDFPRQAAHKKVTHAMKAEMNLQRLIATMSPELNQRKVAFVVVEETTRIGNIPSDSIISAFREQEGTTVIIDLLVAEQLRLPILYRAAWITLTVHSALEAIGLTATFATALSGFGISCNVVAAGHHDHIFVPIASAQTAMDVLRNLQLQAQIEENKKQMSLAKKIAAYVGSKRNLMHKFAKVVDELRPKIRCLAVAFLLAFYWVSFDTRGMGNGKYIASLITLLIPLGLIISYFSWSSIYRLKDTELKKEKAKTEIWAAFSLTSNVWVLYWFFTRDVGSPTSQDVPSTPEVFFSHISVCLALCFGLVTVTRKIYLSIRDAWPRP